MDFNATIMDPPIRIAALKLVGSWLVFSDDRVLLEIKLLEIYKD
jgi:hypothetical protein